MRVVVSYAVTSSILSFANMSARIEKCQVVVSVEAVFAVSCRQLVAAVAGSYRPLRADMQAGR